MSSTMRDVEARQAFEAAILPHMDELLGSAVRLTGTRAEADDLVQEATLRAWAFWPRFEQGTNARAWMHRILMNTFINGYRRKKREREMLTEVRTGNEDAVEGDPHEETTAVGDEVEAALAALPEEFRAVVTLVDLNERSYKEVAAELGCPIGTVMSRLHRARRALKRRLRAYAASEGYIAQAA